MWKSILEALAQVVRLTADTQQNRQDIKALEKRLLDFTVAIDAKINELVRADERLANEIQRLADALKVQQAHEEAERKILKLELENHLLRRERGLPPAQPRALPEAAPEDSATDSDETDKQ